MMSLQKQSHWTKLLFAVLVLLTLQQNDRKDGRRGFIFVHASSTTDASVAAASTTSVELSVSPDAIPSQPPSRYFGQRIVRRVMNEHVDSNKDGKISLNEGYGMIMEFYALLGQQVPIKPPRRKTVQKLFGVGNKYISIQEFERVAATLASRAGVRSVAHLIVSCLVGPYVAIKSADKITSDNNIVGKKKNVVTAVFMVTAIKQFGNLFLFFVDWLLNTFEPFRKLFKVQEEHDNIF